VKNIYNGLSAMHTKDHRYLLDVLAMLACRVAVATTNEPHGRVPKDLEDIMRAVQRVDAVGDSLYGSPGLCASVLLRSFP
jgi:hypothetical protein